MNRNILFIPTIILFFYIPICSAEFNWKPDYISIGLGELNSTSITSSVSMSPATNLSSLNFLQKHKPADDSSFTLGLGFNVNENFSLEIAYSDLGNSEEVQDGGCLINTPTCGLYSHYYNHSSFQINSLTKTKLNNNIDLYLKLGIGRTNISRKTSNTFIKTVLSDHSDLLSSFYPKENIELIYGVGLSYDLINKLKLFVDLLITDMTGLNLVIRQV